jgi:enhancer of mRNA-decapping protein 4
MHLITPSEIVSGVLTSAESVASGSLQNVKAEAKHFDERKSNQTVELEAGKETQILAEKERPAKPSEQTVDTVSACTITTDKCSIEDSRPLADRPVPIPYF